MTRVQTSRAGHQHPGSKRLTLCAISAWLVVSGATAERAMEGYWGHPGITDFRSKMDCSRRVVVQWISVGRWCERLSTARSTARHAHSCFVQEPSRPPSHDSGQRGRRHSRISEDTSMIGGQSLPCSHGLLVVTSNLRARHVVAIRAGWILLFSAVNLATRPIREGADSPNPQCSYRTSLFLCAAPRLPHDLRCPTIIQR
jgi:hypothetical protein